MDQAADVESSPVTHNARLWCPTWDPATTSNPQDRRRTLCGMGRQDSVRDRPGHGTLRGTGRMGDGTVHGMGDGPWTLMKNELIVGNRLLQVT